MKKNTLNVIQFIGLLAAGIALIYFSLRNIPYEELALRIREGNYWMCLPVYVVSLSGYFFRTERCRMFYETMDLRPRRSMLFVSLCIGYLVSFAVPRLGEVVRCLLVKKSDRVPVTSSVLTIVTERILDTFCLFFIIAFAFMLQAAEHESFVTDNVFKPLRGKLGAAGAYAWVLPAAVVACVVLFIVLRYFHNRMADRAGHAISDFIKGLVAMKEKGKFFLLTFLIWLCYFLMTYLWFFMFPDSAQLGWREALLVMAIGSIGRSIPIQGGGMGAYHFLVSHALALFGISLLTGNALAIIIHGAQAVFTFFTGGVCYAWFLISMKKQTFAS